jgi:hypothetical protein
MADVIDETEGDDGAVHDFWRFVLEHRANRGAPFVLDHPIGFLIALAAFERWRAGGPA